MTSDPHYLELVEIARRIHAKEISSVEATKAQLDRIGTVDKKLLSYALLTPPEQVLFARLAVFAGGVQHREQDRHATGLIHLALPPEGSTATPEFALSTLLEFGLKYSKGLEGRPARVEVRD